jgi:hypothetical protein
VVDVARPGRAVLVAHMCRYGRVLNPLLRIDCESATEHLSTLSPSPRGETPQIDSYFWPS